MDKNIENKNMNTTPAEKLMNLVYSVGKIVLPKCPNLTNIPKVIKNKGQANNSALNQYHLAQMVSQLNPTAEDNENLVLKCTSIPSLLNVANSVGEKECARINRVTSQYSLLQKASKLSVVTKDTANLVYNLTNRSSMPDLTNTVDNKRVIRAISQYNLLQKASKLNVATEDLANLASECTNNTSLTNITSVYGKKEYVGLNRTLSQYNLLQKASKLRIVSEDNTNVTSSGVNRARITNIATIYVKQKYAGVNREISQYNLLQKASNLNIATEDLTDLTFKCTNGTSLTNIANISGKKEGVDLNRTPSQYNLLHKGSKLNVATEDPANLASKCIKRPSLTNIGRKKMYVGVNRARSQYNVLRKVSTLTVIPEETSDLVFNPNMLPKKDKWH